MSKQSKEYWRQKKAEQRAKKATVGTMGTVVEKAKEYPEGYDAGGLEMVAYTCAKCGRSWSGSKFYEGPCPYCKAGVVRGDLAGVDLAIVGDPSPKPEEATEEEWVVACERAERARVYAGKMPEHVGPGDMKFQDPVWQWWNQVLTPVERASRRVSIGDNRDVAKEG
jgi:hypothetical protein